MPAGVGLAGRNGITGYRRTSQPTGFTSDLAGMAARCRYCAGGQRRWLASSTIYHGRIFGTGMG